LPRCGSGGWRVILILPPSPHPRSPAQALDLTEWPAVTFLLADSDALCLPISAPSPPLPRVARLLEALRPLRQGLIAAAAEAAGLEARRLRRLRRGTGGAAGGRLAGAIEEVGAGTGAESAAEEAAAAAEEAEWAEGAGAGALEAEEEEAEEEAASAPRLLSAAEAGLVDRALGLLRDHFEQVLCGDVRQHCIRSIDGNAAALFSAAASAADASAPAAAAPAGAPRGTAAKAPRCAEYSFVKESFLARPELEPAELPFLRALVETRLFSEYADAVMGGAA
jgi:hypothetical protein